MKGGRVLSVAGSDPGGGAGIQADVKTITVLGGFGMTVITALTVQNTLGVREIYELPPDFVARQFDAVAEDIGIDAVKTGMLPNRGIVEIVARKIREYGIEKVVVDPVLMAKGGESLMNRDAISVMMEKLLPLSQVITPNIPEAEALSGIIIATPGDMKKAAIIIHNLGAKNVVVKGGHLPGNAGESLDILYDGSGFHEFRATRIDTKDTHGTGCAYSAAIAACLAEGKSVAEAVAMAKEYITVAIRDAWRLGKGQGPVNHLAPVLRGDGLPCCRKY
ncbi:MAG: bifunctional hydroxymethylpyrimidine kinase/phosphomethylpyrimidine kinase [Syntrophales bacterium]|nr:bifunctional hydroxymethylpyrimidine kinase/phosphomethylpyrimidine kinase [Syntrophales bacterium]